MREATKEELLERIEQLEADKARLIHINVSTSNSLTLLSEAIETLTPGNVSHRKASLQSGLNLSSHRLKNWRKK
jgi:hypothetical protein